MPVPAAAAGSLEGYLCVSNGAADLCVLDLCSPSRPVLATQRSCRLVTAGLVLPANLEKSPSAKLTDKTLIRREHVASLFSGGGVVDVMAVVFKTMKAIGREGGRGVGLSSSLPSRRRCRSSGSTDPPAR